MRRDDISRAYTPGVFRAAGLKVSPGKNFLIFAAGLFSLTDDVGLQDEFTAVFGVEWNY